MKYMSLECYHLQLATTVLSWRGEGFLTKMTLDQIKAISVFVTVEENGNMSSHFVPIEDTKVRRVVNFIKHAAQGGRFTMSNEEYDLTRLIESNEPKPMLVV